MLMSERVFFQSHGRIVCAEMRIDPAEFIAAWSDLQKVMIRSVPPGFTRDEWAYLIAFLGVESLSAPIEQSFGRRIGPTNGFKTVYVPRGTIAVWLPNNVSLLGPLTAVLLSLTGQHLKFKLGSRGDNLVESFLDYAVQHTQNDALRHYIESSVECLAIRRDAPEVKQLVDESAVRIVFGSDNAAKSVHDLSSTPSSVGFSFIDKHSEAWIDSRRLNDAALIELVKVFAIYGRAGCTSPKRVVLLEGTQEQALDLQRRLVQIWDKVVVDDTPPHQASENVMARQWALANNWCAELVERNKGVIAVGDMSKTPAETHLCMNVVTATLEQALEHLPSNTQTVGYLCDSVQRELWLTALCEKKIHRFVPLGEMHHFSHVWDGQNFWAGCFQALEVGA